MRVGGDKLNDVFLSKVEEEDIYEDLLRLCVVVLVFLLEIGGGFFFLRIFFKVNNVYLYENYCILVKE